ncbi:hypothetical protein F4776DRAFT_630810 [Hypoxylon sp. NC0597]|nr:hypothetical protein F4776DRAFT_630810 [Hypoxylon sp. NC0597]
MPSSLTHGERGRRPSKSSSSELTEVINSMFAWYRDSKLCYAYLEDFPSVNEPLLVAFRKSKWFSRGWMLQELLAPKKAHFYTRDWD